VEGYNYEDAIILSERLVKDDVLTSIHIEEHEVDARDTKLGAEEITGTSPTVRGDPGDLDERGIIRIGAEVGPGDVLVGKVTPKGETEQTPESACCAPSSARRPARSATPRSRSPTASRGRSSTCGSSPATMPTSCRLAWSSCPGDVAQKRKISRRQAGRPARQQGVISKILPIEDMPFQADGTPVDIILNPLGVPSRMNVGQVLESTRLRRPLGMGRGRRRGDHAAARHRDQDQAPQPILRCGVHPGVRRGHWDEEADAGRHPTIQQIFRRLNPTASTVRCRCPTTARASCSNGRTGEAYDNPISVGYVYILKLHHLVDDKIHARSPARTR